MSTSLLLGAVGAGIGYAYDAPGIGYAIGSLIGSAIDSFGNTQLQNTEGPRLNDLRVQGSSYGLPIPIHFGRNRIAGTIIWAPAITEHSTTTTTTTGGGKGSHFITQTQTTYTYTASFAVLLCRGPVSGFGRIWMDGTLFYDARGGTTGGVYSGSARANSILFYMGDENQKPDSTIEADKGHGNVPAYRGSVYIVFKDLQIDYFGRRIPNVTVEVFKSGKPEQGKKFPSSKGTYHWGNPDSSYNNVFTRISSGVLRVLNQQDKTVRLLNTDGQIIGFSKFDPNQDGDGCSRHKSCGRLNGCNLEMAGEIWIRFDGINPMTGKQQEPPQIRTESGINLLNSVPDQTQILLGFCISADQRRAMIITADGKTPWNLSPPKTWYLVYLSGDQVVVEASGSAVGLPVEIVCGYGLGNRTGVYVGSAWGAGVLESDYKHFWTITIDSLRCYRVEANSMTLVYENTIEGGYASHTLTADHGMCWVTASYNICVFTRLQIATSEDPPLSQIVSDICQLSTLTPKDIDTSQLNEKLIGYTISRQTSIRAALQQLMSAYLFDAVESGGKIKFVPRGVNSIVSIHEDKLAAHSENSALPDVITLKRQQDLELPKRVNVTYLTSHADYQMGYQHATRIQSNSVNENTLELPVVMSDDKAAQIADTVLYGMWLARETHQFNIGMEYLYLEPGDVVTIQTKRDVFCSRIMSVEMGSPGMLIIQGVADDASVYSSTATGGDIVVPDQPLTPAGPTEFHLLDIPIIRTADNSPGFYVATCGYYDSWKGASLIQSTAGNIWSQIKLFVSPSSMGIANTVLKEGLTTIPDVSNVLNVRLLKNMELSSITDEQLLSGGNLAAIGSEIIQFRDAILQKDGTYHLSYLLRGRFGTEWATVLHQEHEEFTLLSENSIQHVTTESNAIGSTHLYKAVTLGMSSDSASEKHFTHHSVGLKPYAPVHIAAQRDNDLNIKISWIRRARFGGEWRDHVDVPLGETNESYEIEIINHEKIIRTLSSKTTVVIYTAAQQKEDGFALGKPISIKIYQLSAIVGRGFPAKAII